MRFLFAILWGMIACEPRTLNSFKDVTDTLTQGNNVKALFVFSQCIPSIPAYASLDLNPFNLYSENNETFVAASCSKMVMDSQTKTLVQNYVRLRLFVNNDTELLTLTADTNTYKIIDNRTFRCDFGRGVTYVVS